MSRLFALALLIACPCAHAQQDDDVEGAKLARAFGQTDLDALGSCQARLEGASLILVELEGWLAAQNQTNALQSLRDQIERGAPLLGSFAEVRRLASTAQDMDLARSEAAHDGTREIFRRRPGEDERAFHTRAKPETALAPDCREALKRGRWKVEIDGLGGGQ